MSVGLRALAAALVLALLPAAVSAQGLGQGVATSATAPGDEARELDYAAWERLATRAEVMAAAGTATVPLMEQVRAQVADWRAAFLAAQGANASRIATLRGQIEALGPPPAEGETEAEEIAARRRTLTEQLVRLQAPVLAAEEAYSRANGIISEIDRVLRERQADALLRLMPAPVNPANWPAAAETAAGIAATLWQEVTRNLAAGSGRAKVLDRLPSVAALLALAVVLLWRGRPWFERWPHELQARASARGRELWSFLASLGQIVVPAAGVLAFAQALVLTGLAGPLGLRLLHALPAAGVMLYAARWLGFRVFPLSEPRPGGMQLDAGDRAAGRLDATLAGAVLALETLRRALADPLRTPEAAAAVLGFPLLVVAGVLLVRLGRRLCRHAAAAAGAAGADGAARYRDGLLGILGRLVMAAGIAGPLIAAVGYVPAGAALVYPALGTLALIALLMILQRLVGDIFALFGEGTDPAQGGGLATVLIGFALTLASLPLLALIWGARWSDITEVFARLSEGFAIGETRISPANFLTFLAVFAAGYLVTRLVQGALRTTILPKTRLDAGGQNAAAVGTGYLGIILSALVAVNAAGIDLSGLAFVAGALSLGLGFGLQNIVQNFVSGVILLIERPVSEGDWIEVGGIQGIVKAISVRSTRIQTFDRTDVIVPNADLVSGQVTNWTRFNLTGRVVMPFAVGIGADTGRVEAILREVAEAQPLVILNPPPQIALMGYGNNLLNYELRVILRDVNFSVQVRSDIYREAVRRLIAEKFVIVPGMPESIVHQGRPWTPPPESPQPDTAPPDAAAPEGPPPAGAAPPGAAPPGAPA